MELTLTPRPCSLHRAPGRLFPTQLSLCLFWLHSGIPALRLPGTGRPYLAPGVQRGQDDVVGVGGGRGAGQRGQSVLAPALGQLGVALPAAEQQPVGALTHQVAAVALLRPGLGPVGAVLLPLIGGRQEVEGRLAGGSSQDPSVWPWLDLGHHAPYKQDDLAGAAPGSAGSGDHKETLSLLLLLLLLLLSRFSRVQLFVIPWTVAGQSPLSMEFSRQDYWSGFPFPSPRDLPNPGTEPRSPTLQAGSLPSEQDEA